ncbi:MAG: hypothetical protein ACPG19_10795 [Saprospiraceae bacterium]
MIAFLNEQLAKVEAEIEQFIINRGRASIETVGSYEIMIERKKEERLKLLTEIEELQNPTFSKSSKPKVNPNFTKIKQLIQKNKTEQAIDIMLETWSDDEAIPVLSARFHGVKRENRIGILSHSQYQLASNQINHSLLSILQDIENETL